MVTRRDNARPQARRSALRTELGIRLFFGLATASAFAGADVRAEPKPSVAGAAAAGTAAAGSGAAGPDAAGALGTANGSIEALVETLAALDALARGQGRGTPDAPLFAAAKASNKSHGFLCLIESGQGDNCPAAPTGSTTGSTAQCTLCSSIERDRTWQRYLRAELGVRALGFVLAMRLDQSTPMPTAERLTTWLKALEGAAPRGKALQTALSELFSAQTPKARSAAFYKQLQVVLAALELSMTPDDLAEEGGLRATLKLATHTRDAARAEWQRQFTTWSQCHTDAIGRGQLGLSDANEVERCNRRAMPGANADAALQSYRLKQHERRACLDSTLQLKLSIAQHQASACADGALISGR